MKFHIFEDDILHSSFRSLSKKVDIFWSVNVYIIQLYRYLFRNSINNIIIWDSQIITVIMLIIDGWKTKYIENEKWKMFLQNSSSITLDLWNKEIVAFKVANGNYVIYIFSKELNVLVHDNAGDVQYNWWYSHIHILGEGIS